MINLRKQLQFILVTCCLLAADQLTKLAAAKGLSKPVQLIPGILQLQYLENRGAAFGMMQGRQWIFILFALIMMVGLLFIYPRLREGRHFTPLRVICCLLAAGAAGNMIDRLIRGYVVDFIYFSIIDFPIFNVADIYVTCSCAFLLILLFFVYKDEEVII